MNSSMPSDLTVTDSYAKTSDVASRALDLRALREFYETVLIPSFPVRSHGQLRHDFGKHVFEVSLIVKSIKNHDKAAVLDVGAGAGINAIILSRFCGFKSYVIDRYDEFNESYNRSVGSERSISENMASFGVHVIKSDFVKDGFPFEQSFFDAIGSFDVIEHFTFSPLEVLNKLAGLLKPGGALLIGTPNQVHIMNRLKALVGKNTWEDLDYYLRAPTFYGHVRELTPAELKTVLGRVTEVGFEVLKFSGYPFYARLRGIKNPILRGLLTPLVLAYALLTSCVPNLDYYMVGIARRLG